MKLPKSALSSDVERATRARNSSSVAVSRENRTSLRTTVLSASSLLRREIVRSNESDQLPIAEGRFDSDDFHQEDDAPEESFADTDELFEEPEGELDSFFAARLDPEITFFRIRGETLFEVRPIAEDILMSESADDGIRRSDQLRGYALTLAKELNELPNLNESLSRLLFGFPSMSQVEFVERLNRNLGRGSKLRFDATQVNRDRQLLIAFPRCRASLGMLLRSDRGRDAVTKIGKILRSNPKLNQAELIAKLSKDGISASAVKMYQGWIQLALLHPAVVAQFRASLELSPSRYELLIDSFARILKLLAAKNDSDVKVLRAAPERHREPPLWGALVGWF